MNIGNRMIELRRQRNLSQAQLGEQVGVSREMIGRYERNEVLPSIEVAKNIADTLLVSLDYLVGEGVTAQFDKQTLKLLHDIEELDPSVKEKLLFVAYAIIRDYKAARTYSNS